MTYLTQNSITGIIEKNKVVMSLDQYPSIVQHKVTVVDTGPYYGWCYSAYNLTVVTVAGFAHEMGHATAKLLGIETELGTLAMNSSGAKSVTNENIFCYGAQQLYAGNYEQALAEYAADAIQAYTEKWHELPENIKTYLDSKW